MIRYYLKMTNPIVDKHKCWYYHGFCQRNGVTQNSNDLDQPMWFENKGDANRLLDRVNSPSSGVKEKYEIVEIVI